MFATLVALPHGATKMAIEPIRNFGCGYVYTRLQHIVPFCTRVKMILDGTTQYMSCGQTDTENLRTDIYRERVKQVRWGS